MDSGQTIWDLSLYWAIADTKLCTASGQSIIESDHPSMDENLLLYLSDPIPDNNRILFLSPFFNPTPLHHNSCDYPALMDL